MRPRTSANLPMRLMNVGQRDASFDEYFAMIWAAAAGDVGRTIRLLSTTIVADVARATIGIETPSAPATRDGIQPPSSLSGERNPEANSTVRVCPPTESAASSTTTRLPRLASVAAALSPFGPAPTTIA